MGRLLQLETYLLSEEDLLDEVIILLGVYFETSMLKIQSRYRVERETYLICLYFTSIRSQSPSFITLGLSSPSPL